jgi:hypothetical protein
MGITLVEHVLDHAPDDLTPAEWRGLIVLAQDANEKSRVTFHGPNDPLILRRVRMSESRWNSVRSALVKKGALEQVAGGHKGAVAKYRIPVFKTELVAGNRQPMHAQRLPETEPKVAGNRHQRLPETGNPTPPSPTSPLSARLPQQTHDSPAAPVEREINDDEQMVLTAYTEALGRKPMAAVVEKLRKQTAALISDGLPAWWIADRARELPGRGWTDLAKHCEMSNVPTEVVRPADEQKTCDRGHDKFDPMIRDPERGLVNCPDCHPAEIARRRRQGAAA